METNLGHFLLMCVYPDYPRTKRFRISTDTAISPLLETRVGKLPDGPIFDLCMEVSVWGETAREFSHGRKLVTLLNERIPKFPVRRNS